MGTNYGQTANFLPPVETNRNLRNKHTADCTGNHEMQERQIRPRVRKSDKLAGQLARDSGRDLFSVFHQG